MLFLDLSLILFWHSLSLGYLHLGSEIQLMGCPEHHSPFAHLLGQIVNGAVFDASGHAMLYTCGFKALAYARCTEAADFSGKRDE
jgi:hypothetical protein